MKTTETVIKGDEENASLYIASHNFLMFMVWCVATLQHELN